MLKEMRNFASMFVRKIGFILFIQLICFGAFGFQLPKGMTADERKVAMQVLGFGTTAKFSSNPFPLGGWSGVEFSIQQEVVPVDRLSTLGSAKGSNGDLAYTQLSFGKGFYKDFDAFISFTLPRQRSEIQNYSGLLRWMVYDFDSGKYLASVDMHGHGSNISNLFSSDSFGYDLVVSKVEAWWGLYLGAGWLQVKTKFIGNKTDFAQGMTSNGQTVVDSEDRARYFTGFNLRYQNYFAVAEIQRVYDTAYSIKLGYRY